MKLLNDTLDEFRLSEAKLQNLIRGRAATYFSDTDWHVKIIKILSLTDQSQGVNLNV
jgi:hypothetical protein